MKANILKSFSVVAASALLFSCGSKTETAQAGGEQAVAEASALSKNYTVDVQNSRLGWRGEKVTGAFHYGVISIASGNVSVENDAITGGSFVIDMNTIKSEDLTDAEKSAKLVGHLSSADFFDVANFPTSTFEISGAEKLAQPDSAGNNFKVNGNLTIKGITKNIPIFAKVTMDSLQFEAVSSFAIDRTDWDVRYGSGKFFENLGDNMIKDAIQFELSLKANAQ